MSELVKLPIRDADLIEELEKFPEGTPGRDRMVRFLSESQRRRDEERSRLAQLPREKRRRIETSEQLRSEAVSRADLRHMHSVLAVCGLPYRQLPADQRDYRRQQGNMAITVTSGMLEDERGTPHLQPIPFGPKARLIMLHLCSEAIRQKTPTVEIADTLTGFVREMGYPNSAGTRGPVTAFKRQLNALAACTMRMSVWGHGKVSMRHITPIEALDLWLPSNPEQRTLWPSTVTFSPTMYESLKRHALPVNIRAVRALAGSARKLDLYFWLSYRMSRLDEPLYISWEALAEQFGQGYAQSRQFRAAFRRDLQAISELLPELPADITEIGIELRPANLSKLALPRRQRARRRRRAPPAALRR